MITIKKKLAFSFIASSIITIITVIIFVNIAINNQFETYMKEVQNKRYTSVVTYFEELYKKDKSFEGISGNELIHEAFMSNYCITLMDESKNILWGVNTNNIDEDYNFTNMHRNDKGVYNSKTFELKYNNEIVGYIEVGQYSPILLTEEDENFIVSINRSIVISTIIAILIGILISIYLAREFSKPISKISKVSTQLSLGNYNIKSPENTKIKEMDDLIDNINYLAEKLNNQDLLRKQLVSDISHEIRTPLNILQNNLEAMVDGIFPITKERLVNLNSEVIRFGRLLNNLEALKGAEADNIKLNIIDVDLGDLILEIYDEFKLRANSKSIKFNYMIDFENDYVLKGDKDKLKQVFINLLNNSIKFTEPNGEITIHLFKENYKTVCIVEDNGIGISKSDLPYIFERLYRGDKGRNNIEGNGIGLAIVKSIIHKHNANILVESEVDKGSSFKIIFNEFV